MVSIIIISTRGSRVVQKFQDSEMGKSFLKKASKAFSSQHVYLVNNSEAIEPPNDYQPQRRGTLYCPYCGEERRFYEDDKGYKVCPVCRVSDHSFYVRHFNKLWSLTDKKKKGGKK
jgi:hypothetical protein